MKVLEVPSIYSSELFMNQESSEIDHTCSQVGNSIMLPDNPLYLEEKIQPTLRGIN